MRPVPIRVRLTVWYFLILAASLLVVAFFTPAVLRHAVHRTVDRELNEHMTAIQRIVREDGNRSLAALHHDLNEDVELAPDVTLLEIWGADGQVAYRSPAMNRMQIPGIFSPGLEHPRTRSYGRHRLRILVRQVAAHGVNYKIMVAIPTQDFAEAIRRVQRTIWIAIPVLLLISVAGGYWIAGYAFAPIRSMIAAAEAIHPGDLSARLEVPKAEDEMRRLALTLNRMLARLQSGFERITRFTADASHELRTPITLLRTRTEILLRRPRSLDEYRGAHERNLEELEKTSGLLENLLLLARADAGAEGLHFEDMNLTALVRATAAAAAPLAEIKRIAWSIAVPDEPVHVHGDRAALQRLLMVLLDNAVKYTPQDGRVRIHLRAEEDAAVVEVDDSGPGIPEEVLPHVFDRFYRGDTARTTDGAGLGLSIGRWIAEQHSGAITVQSRPGDGSIFQVRLPAARR